MRNSIPKILICLALTSAARLQDCLAQSAAPRSSPPRPATARSADSPDTAKKEILGSKRWRDAVYGLNEWLSVQSFYDATQVAEMKADLDARVAKMSGSALQMFLEDLEAKLEILKTQQAQEALAWMAQDLAAYAPAKRTELLKKMPNLGTMTAAQLSLDIMKVQDKRASLAQTKAAYERSGGGALSNPWGQQAAAGQQSYVQEHSQAASANYSPYRRQADPNAKYAHPDNDQSISYYVGPYGGFGLMYSPNRW